MPHEPIERLRAALAARYRILRELGRGGMATVYLADDLKHDRRVAVKVLQPELAAALGPERFLREIQIAAVLAHPHILPLHDSGTADDFVYYVMPYVDGESLRDRLSREHRLPVAEAVRIVQEIADALAYAHGRGVVHRDIKPDNIMILAGHAVVTDFGVATAVNTAGGPQLTESGVTVGTPLYMSPEQALGEPGLDGRSDTYSLGCVLYEMLTGAPPFGAATAAAVLARKLTEPAPSLAGVPPGLDQVVQRALALAPADRFPTTPDFARAAAAAVAAASLGTRGRTGRWGRAVAGAALALLLLGGLWMLRARWGDAPAAPAHATTLGVLPFENLGPADEDYFAAGMTDEIATRLSSISGLSVVPRRATQRYARPDVTLRDIGRQLGIEYLLVGSVRWGAGGPGPRSVRITIELVGARDERQVWSSTYDRVIDDIFDVQSDIASQVITRLGVTALAGEQRRLRAQPTTDHRAYTLYLKGRYFWNKRTAADIDKALTWFQQAVDLDPGYALAWTGIADIWIFRGWYGFLAPRETFPKAMTAARQALAFDSTLAEAHTSLAHIVFEFDHDWAAAERSYRRAIQLDPRYAVAHHWYGGFLSGMGRHDEALREAEAAHALDPLSPIIQTWVGLRHYFAGRAAEAIPLYRKALDLDAAFAPAHWHMGWALEATGRVAEGIAAAERAVVLEPANLLYVASLGRALAGAGREREARGVLARLEAAAATRYVPAYDVAVLHAALGDTTRALDWLTRAVAERSPWTGYLAVDPRVNALRGSPRFVALLRQAGLPAGR